MHVSIPPACLQYMRSNDSELSHGRIHRPKVDCGSTRDVLLLLRSAWARARCLMQALLENAVADGIAEHLSYAGRSEGDRDSARHHSDRERTRYRSRSSFCPLQPLQIKDLPTVEPFSGSY